MIAFFEFIWGVPLVIFIILSGVFLGLCTHFFQVSKFITLIKETVLSKDNKAKKVFLNVLGGTVGAGNIIGIATAIAVGGPGSIFWMWIIAFFSMSTKMVEVTLAVKYHVKRDNQYVGGPMYYISHISGKIGKIMGAIYTFALLMYVLCDACFAQVNTASTAILDTFTVSPIIIAAFFIFISVILLIGGISRISTFLTKSVPFMCIIYIAIALTIVVINFKAIPNSFIIIVKYAFSPTPMVGGFLGSTVAQAMSKGAARGIFANEAGLGTATTVYATNDNEPIVQGMWGIIEVFFVSFIVCTISGLLVLTTNAWTTGLNGAPMVLYAFNSFGGQIGKYFFCFIIVLIAYSTYVGFYYEFNTCLNFFFSQKAIKYIKWIYILPIIFAIFLPIDVIWNIADIAVGFLALINIVSLILLSRQFVEELTKYNETRKRIKD